MPILARLVATLSSAAAPTSTALLLLLASSPTLASDLDRTFSKHTLVISGEATLAHFGPRLNNPSAVVQAWNLSARISLLPFGVWRFNHFDGAADGSLEVGLEPTFQRFQAERQNFAGLGLALRYYLLHFQYGPLVPWLDASIGPGGTDLRIGHFSNDTRLHGPFMNLIQGGVGASYFVTDRSAVYFGFRAQHISNGGFDGPNSNFALNTVKGFVAGISWFVP